MFAFFYRTNRQYKFVRNINYCDTDSIESDCQECPENSLCSEGVVSGCLAEFSFVNQEICLEEKQMKTLLFRMYIHTLDIIARNNGENICHQSGTLLFLNLFWYYKLV